MRGANLVRGRFASSRTLVRGRMFANLARNRARRQHTEGTLLHKPKGGGEGGGTEGAAPFLHLRRRDRSTCSHLVRL